MLESRLAGSWDTFNFRVSRKGSATVSQRLKQKLALNFCSVWKETEYPKLSRIPSILRVFLDYGNCFSLYPSLAHLLISSHNTHLSFTTMGSSHSETLGITAILTITNQMEILEWSTRCGLSPFYPCCSHLFSTARAKTLQTTLPRFPLPLDFMKIQAGAGKNAILISANMMMLLDSNGSSQSSSHRGREVRFWVLGKSVLMTELLHTKNAYLYDLSSFHSFNWLW